MAGQANGALNVGDMLTGVTRTFTIPRRRWYSAGLRTAGLCQVTGPRMGGIHDDNDYARGQGMKGAIMDGMTITNWCSSLLLKHFGLDYVANGDLRTKFIKPTYIGDVVTVHAKVLSKQTAPNGGQRYELDVWCTNQDGAKITDGSAIVVKAAA
jgi:3-hydroxybutyryl-CoA dehydratase